MYVTIVDRSEDDDLEKRRDVVRDTRYLPQSSPINLLASPESRMDHRVLSETSPPADRLKDCQVRAERLSSRKKASHAACIQSNDSHVLLGHSTSLVLVILWSLLGWLSCLWSLYQSSIGLLVVIVRLVVLFVVTLPV